MYKGTVHWLEESLPQTVLAWKVQGWSLSMSEHCLLRLQLVTLPPTLSWAGISAALLARCVMAFEVKAPAIAKPKAATERICFAKFVFIIIKL